MNPIQVKTLIDVLTPTPNTSNPVNNPNSSEYELSLFKNSPYVSRSELVNYLNDRKHCFTAVSLNCQSLRAKFDEICILLQYLSENSVLPSAICLQETWLSDKDDTSSFDLNKDFGYNMIDKPLSCSSHGGLIIYLQKNFEPVILPSYDSAVFENQFIRIKLNGDSKKNICIGNFYRPPKTEKFTETECIKTFSTEFCALLDQYSKSSSHIMFAGDYNVDLLQVNENGLVINHFDNIMSQGFIPSITLPTRFDSFHGSYSLLDNILIKSNINLPKYSAAILSAKISDHLACFISVDFPTSSKTNKKPPKFITIRKNTPVQTNKFISYLASEEIKNQFLSEVHSNPNTVYENLHSTLNKGINECFPEKKVKFDRHKHKHNEWMTNGILKSIAVRDEIYVDFVKETDRNRRNALKSTLDNFNVIMKDLIKKAKQNHIKSIFERSKGNLKKTWKSINEVLNRNKDYKAFPDNFIIDGTETSDKGKIANAFNNFFTDIGTNLASTIPPPTSNVTFTDFLSAKSKLDFHFINIDRDTILKAIDSLPSKSSSGFDSISSSLLKSIKNEICDVLTSLINLSFEQGIFPDKLKIAKVTPVYKKSDIHLIDNYRPISLLPAISKVFERIMHNQLYDYFTDNNLFFSGQYGFRSRHSTELASVELVDKILDIMKSGEIPISIFMDLSKAFDTLDHNILLHKLDHYGVRNNSLKLFQSYLSDREQFVLFDGVSSERKTIRTGVPQGSILGPLLFLIYINDISSASSIFCTTSYADDTTLTASLNDFKSENCSLSSSINNELSKISDWLIVNKLSLNISKTNYMLFYKPLKIVPEIQLHIRSQSLKPVKEFIFLGLTIDSQLTWKPQIDKISNKISKVTGVLARFRNILPKEILITLYNSLILPYINYAILTWGFSNTKRVLKLQKKALRIITGSKFKAHTDGIFNDLKLLKVDDIFFRGIFKFCFQLSHKLLPSNLNSFSLTKGSHRHDTRQRSAIRPASNSKIYISACVRAGIIKIMNFISDTYDPSYKYPQEDFITNFSNDKLLSLPKLSLANFIDKIDLYTLQGYSAYVKNKLLENYDTTPCSKPNCFSCGRST